MHFQFNGVKATFAQCSFVDVADVASIVAGVCKYRRQIRFFAELA